MSETNDSGNRWERSAEADESAETTVAEAPAEADPIEVPATPAATEAAADAAASRTSRLPRWVTTSGLVTTGAATAIFLGGGGVGYAIGANHDNGNQAPQGRFDRAGFNGHGPDGQFPGNGQGRSFGGPNSQQAPQDQSQSQSQSQSQGNGSGSSSGSGTSS